MSIKEIDLLRGSILINGSIWVVSIVELPFMNNIKASSYIVGGIILLLFSIYYRQHSLTTKNIPTDIAFMQGSLASLLVKILFPLLWFVNLVTFATQATPHLYFPLFLVATLSFGSGIGSYFFMRKQR
jgi:hypothetical protein